MEVMTVQKVSTKTFGNIVENVPFAEKECIECKKPFKLQKYYFKGRLQHQDNENETTCYPCKQEIENKQIADKVIADKKKAEAQRNIKIFEKYSLIPDDLKSARFKNYKPEHPTQLEVYNVVKGYVLHFAEHLAKEKDFQSLLLQGSFGVGKSHLSISIAEYLKSKGFTSIFIDIPSFLRLIRQTYRKNADITEDEIFKAINDADLVVFDDLGAEYVKDTDKESWAVEQLFSAIQTRIGKPTIYTTNYKPGELVDKYGQKQSGRILSRMMKGTKRFTIEGKDGRIEEY
jgi:DNA replication protein DnaC